MWSTNSNSVATLRVGSNVDSETMPNVFAAKPMDCLCASDWILQLE